jgi:Mg2+ and Co2+ transporter CorA
MNREKYKWQLAEGVKARLSDSSYGRQRAIFDSGQLLLVLHEPPKHDEKERVVTVFLRESDGNWSHNGQKKGESMLRRLLESYRKKLDEYETLYDKAKTADELFAVIEDLNPSVRAVKNLDMAMQSAREAVPDDKLVLEMRDEASDAFRNYELLSEETRLALDYRIAKNAEAQISESRKMGKAQHKLNLMAAITFPMMALSSLFGMNLLSGLEGIKGGLFWVVMTFGFICGISALRWILKDNKNDG